MEDSDEICLQEQDCGPMFAHAEEGMERAVKRRVPRRLVTFDKALPLISLLIILIISPTTLASLVVSPRPDPHFQPLTTRAVENSSLLECLQVEAPVYSPSGCQGTLMVHTFAFSYGQPFVGQYKVLRISSIC